MVTDMKNLIFIIGVIFLTGCEKYELESPPKLTGGKWILTDYDITVISSIGDVTVVKNDTVCINSFTLQHVDSGRIVMRQDYNGTSLDRRFIKGRTTWEFDSNDKELYCNYTQMPGVPRPEPFWVNLSLYDKNLEILNTTNGSVTNYTYRANDVGYPRTLTLLSPSIVTDLYMSNGTRDKAVTVKITLYFMR
jgi:hypothetical protein